MYAALITTRRYQEAQPNGVDRDKQLKLSRLWATAAIKSRVFVRKKGRRSQEQWMMYKAQYWLDHVKWSDEMVKERGIDFDEVEGRIRMLIEESGDT
jgi:hypothetical protein